MTAPVHFAVINDFYGAYSEANACCGNNFRRRKALTGDPREVTCRECLTLMGYEPVAVEQLTIVRPEPAEQIVEVEHLGEGRIAA